MFFYSVFTSKKPIIFYEVNVDVQKRVLMFKGKIDNKCVSFIHCFHMIIVLNDYHISSG